MQTVFAGYINIPLKGMVKAWMGCAGWRQTGPLTPDASRLAV
jgi:hypothetical protein